MKIRQSHPPVVVPRLARPASPPVRKAPLGRGFNQQRYERARKRAKDLKDFYTHVIVYVLVNAGLFVIIPGGGWWFSGPLLGWGIGLGVHALSVFGFSGAFGQDWEEQKTEN